MFLEDRQIDATEKFLITCYSVLCLTVNIWCFKRDFKLINNDPWIVKRLKLQHYNDSQNPP